MNDERVAELIDIYRSGPAEVEAALADCPPDRLDHRPGPGEWSAREIVHHIADSEAISAGRLRLILSRDGATLVAYDQEALATSTRAEARPIESSLAAIKGLRQSTADLLNALEPEAWNRRGMHEELGELSLQRWLAGVARHCHDHADQIRLAYSGR